MGYGELWVMVGYSFTKSAVPFTLGQDSTISVGAMLMHLLQQCHLISLSLMMELSLCHNLMNSNNYVLYIIYFYKLFVSLLKKYYIITDYSAKTIKYDIYKHLKVR